MGKQQCGIEMQTVSLLEDVLRGEEEEKKTQAVSVSPPPSLVSSCFSKNVPLDPGSRSVMHRERLRQRMCDVGVCCSNPGVERRVTTMAIQYNTCDVMCHVHLI